jgi:hypothetical protein
MQTSEQNGEASSPALEHDLAGIANYLTEAINHRDISLRDAEQAILEWTHDPIVLDAASHECALGGRGALLLHRVADHCHKAA